MSKAKIVEIGHRVSWVNILCLSYLALIVLFALFANWIPLSFKPGDQDLFNIYQKPFQWHLYKPHEPFHFLGSDELGRDVWVNLVYGARTALFVSVPTIILAALTGITLGLLAGYFGDSGLRISLHKLLALPLAGFFFYFYFFQVNLIFLGLESTAALILIKVAVVLFSYLFYRTISFLLRPFWFFRKSVKLPVDLTVLKLIELIGAVPRLLLILILATFAPGASVLNIIILSVITFWPGIARLTRAEILRIKNLPYIEAAHSLGYHPWRVILCHALPNMLVPLLVAITFGICNLISLEATLSFLGLSLPEGMVSWGQSINKIQYYYQAWWLVVFPGLAILFTVLSLQNINNLIIKYVEPKGA
jgi:peptide/nickel transport system permease protein